jgi:hypothetical protein
MKSRLLVLFILLSGCLAWVSSQAASSQTMIHINYLHLTQLNSMLSTLSARSKYPKKSATKLQSTLKASHLKGATLYLNLSSSKDTKKTDVLDALSTLTKISGEYAPAHIYVVKTTKQQDGLTALKSISAYNAQGTLTKIPAKLETTSSIYGRALMTITYQNRPIAVQTLLNHTLEQALQADFSSESIPLTPPLFTSPAKNKMFNALFSKVYKMSQTYRQKNKQQGNTIPSSLLNSFSKLISKSAVLNFTGHPFNITVSAAKKAETLLLQKSSAARALRKNALNTVTSNLIHLAIILKLKQKEKIGAVTLQLSHSGEQLNALNIYSTSKLNRSLGQFLNKLTPYFNNKTKPGFTKALKNATINFLQLNGKKIQPNSQESHNIQTQIKTALNQTVPQQPTAKQPLTLPETQITPRPDTMLSITPQF